jgi:putative endonuclease
MSTKKIGQFGEKIAENYLKKKGYQILDRNYKFQMPGDLQKGEIDIVAKKEDKVCFVEVKTLKDPKIEIFPEDKINFSKKKKLIATAESWLIKNKIPLNSKWQIDVISIEIKDKKIKISHFENAISDF